MDGLSLLSQLIIPVYRKIIEVHAYPVKYFTNSLTLSANNPSFSLRLNPHQVPVKSVPTGILIAGSPFFFRTGFEALYICSSIRFHLSSRLHQAANRYVERRLSNQNTALPLNSSRQPPVYLWSDSLRDPVPILTPVVNI